MAGATGMPATPPANWAPVYQIMSARATMPRRWKASVRAGLKCAPERLPQGEYTRAIAVRPMADPIRARRTVGFGMARWTGEPGNSRRDAQRDAEIMNAPST